MIANTSPTRADELGRAPRVDELGRAPRVDEPDGAPRVASLDILRGIAILGILFMNINDMGGPLYALMMGDPRVLGWTMADQVAWSLREIFADGTARCMLEMLFGVGMVILTDRAASAVAAGDAPATGRWTVMRRYYWRNFILFLFGVVHLMVLLWPGDILHTYGLAAMVAFLFRRLRPRWLIVIGSLLALIQFGGGGYGYVDSTLKRAAVERVEAKRAAGQALSRDDRKVLKDRDERRAKRAKTRADDQALLRAENKARVGTFQSWAKAAWDAVIYIEVRFLEILFVWEAAATMLIGAALWKLGIIQGARSRGFYWRMLGVAYAVGLGSRGIGVYDEFMRPDLPSLSWPLVEVARIATTLGHIAAIHLLLGSVAGARLLKPFEAAGRTALSVYIAQTLICLWVLYPPFMLGLYGTQGWASLMLTALAINAVLLWGANVWVRHFAIAPVEWAWRSIVEGRRLPFRRRGGADARGVLAVA